MPHSRGMRRRHKTTRGLTPNQRKAVSKIANRVVKKKLELKEIDYPFNSVPAYIGGGNVSFSSCSFGSGAVMADLVNGITQGTTDSTRIGNKITVRKVKLQFMFELGDAYNMVRIFLITNRSQGPAGSIAAGIQQILSGVSSSATQYSAFIDTDFYKVHWDKIFYVSDHLSVTGGGANSSVPNIKVIKKTLRFPKGLNIQWDHTNVEPSRNLILGCLSDSSAIPNPGTIGGYVRVYYNDA